MLDEWKEYEGYLSEDIRQVPMHKDTLTGQKGFRRPLQILARGFLDKCEDWEAQSGSTMPLTQKLTACKWFLRAWTEGLTPDRFPGSEALPPILQEQIRTAGTNSLIRFGSSVLKDEKKLMEMKLDVARFNDAPYLLHVNLAWNDFNKIYYDQIIADARNRVSLRRQCLVLEGPSVYDGIRCKENTRPAALALAILYLQAKGENATGADQEYIPVTYAQVTNWLGIPFTNKGADRTSVPMAVKSTVTGDKEQLFDRQVMPSGNKLYLNSNWINRYNVRLVDEDMLGEEVTNDCWIVRDGDGCLQITKHVKK